MENKKSSILINVFYILGLTTVFCLLGLLSYYNILPMLHRIIITIGFLIIYIIIGIFVILVSKKSKIVYALITTVLVFMVLAQSYSSYLLFKTFSKYNNQANYEVVSFAVIAKKDNPVDSVSKIGTEEILFSKLDKKEDLDLVKNNINNFNKNANFKQSEDIKEISEKIISNQAKYAIINLSMIDLIEENREDFFDKFKVLRFEEEKNTLSFEIKKERKQTKPIIKDKSFNIFISGTDEYSGLYQATRSDVNILMTINPNTNDILLTTLPRDSYVYMPGLGYDKLTHSGVFGVEKTVETIENLFDLDVEYFVKVNFNSVSEIVDLLGGISLYNPESFVSVIGGHYFPEGQIYLDGDLVVPFVRERKSLAYGDIARGQNHLRVLEALIKRALSVESLLNYDRLLDSALNTMYTDIPSEVIINLINNQIETKKPWNIQISQVEGYASFGLPSYAMPGYELYMFQIDQDNLETIKKSIVDLENKE